MKDVCAPFRLDEAQQIFVGFKRRCFIHRMVKILTVLCSLSKRRNSKNLEAEEVSKGLRSLRMHYQNPSAVSRVTGCHGSFSVDEALIGFDDSGNPISVSDVPVLICLTLKRMCYCSKKPLLILGHDRDLRNTLNFFTVFVESESHSIRPDG